MNQQQLENKIRQAIPELKEEFEAFEDSSIDKDMITPIMLNHVLEYWQSIDKSNPIGIDGDGDLLDGGNFVKNASWNLKSPYLKDQSQEFINFLNRLK